MGKIQLNQELSDARVADIVAFLESLTGDLRQIVMPRLPGLSGSTLLSDG